MQRHAKEQYKVLGLVANLQLTRVYESMESMSGQCCYCPEVLKSPNSKGNFLFNWT